VVGQVSPNEVRCQTPIIPLLPPGEGESTKPAIAAQTYCVRHCHAFSHLVNCNEENGIIIDINLWQIIEITFTRRMKRRMRISLDCFHIFLDCLSDFQDLWFKVSF